MNLAKIQDARWLALIDDLRSLPAETEWVEFKTNNAEPNRIGKTVSAISNVASIWGEQFGYIIWGIHDDSHDVIGTKFEPKLVKHGQEQLELWLAKALSPSISFKFVTVQHPSGRVVLMEIPAANSVPVKFQSISYIRVGSATPKLSDYPEREADLLNKLRPFIWEHAAAINFVSDDVALSYLDVAAYFDLLRQQAPSAAIDVLEHMRADRLIAADVGGRWNILNLGAVLFSKDLTQTSAVARKALRIVQYDGDTRARSRRSRDGTLGYACGFKGALQFIDGLLPSEEKIEGGIREQVRPYPEIAVRELVANALIHQDMTISGTGPIVEISTTGLRFQIQVYLSQTWPKSFSALLRDLATR